jgi:hypothetical protein
MGYGVLPMMRGAWILPAVMLVVLIVAAIVPAAAYATDTRAFGGSMDSYFTDLPGVVPEQRRVTADDYRCTSDIGYISRSRGRNDILRWDDVPMRLYHCKSASGATYTGTQMPNTQWVPGLNPRHLPR